MTLQQIGTVVAIVTGVSGFILGLLSLRASKMAVIREFFLRGESDEIALAKKHVFTNNKFSITDHYASKVASHYEYWGKMVHMGCLPIETFNGAAGIALISLYDRLEQYIFDRRIVGNGANPMYGKEFEWLKKRIIAKYTKKFGLRCKNQ